MAAAVVIGGLIGSGLMSAESRWVAFLIAGVSAAVAGWALAGRDKRAAYPLVLIAAGLTLTPLIPTAPVFGAFAYFIWLASKSDMTRVSSDIWGVAAIIAAIAGAVVWWWADGGPPVLRFIEMPACCTEPFFFISLVVAAAAANSIYEEVLWRHLLPVALGGPRLLVAAVLSLTFGAAHINSLPSGLSGVIMTTAFALVSHALVEAANGSLVPSIGAHFVADVVLLTAVLT